MSLFRLIRSGLILRFRFVAFKRMACRIYTDPPFFPYEIWRYQQLTGKPAVYSYSVWAHLSTQNLK